MTFHHEYPADVHRVLEMMTDEAWLADVARRSGATAYDVSVSGGSSHIHASLPAPDQVRTLVGPTLTVDSTISWGSVDQYGRCLGTLSVDPPHGIPSTISGSAVMGPATVNANEGTEVDYSVDFSIQIPLMGRKLEQAAAPYLMKVIDAQEAASLDYLTR